MNLSDLPTDPIQEFRELPEVPTFDVPPIDDIQPDAEQTTLGDPLISAEQTPPATKEPVATVDATAEELREDGAPDEVADETDDEPTTPQDEDGPTAILQQKPSTTNEDKKERVRRVDSVFDFVELAIFTLIVVLSLSVFLFRHSIVDGGSMESTLHHGDHLIISSMFYTPKAGDIIVFQDAEKHHDPLVKRIIATEGQTVTVLSDTEVLVDGERIVGGYVDGVSDYIYPITCTVSEGHVFVLGDHRNNSADSRRFGEISVECILGRVLIRIYPMDGFGVPAAMPTSDNE